MDSLSAMPGVEPSMALVVRSHLTEPTAPSTDDAEVQLVGQPFLQAGSRLADRLTDLLAHRYDGLAPECDAIGAVPEVLRRQRYRTDHQVSGNSTPHGRFQLFDQRLVVDPLAAAISYQRLAQIAPKSEQHFILVSRLL